MQVETFMNKGELRMNEQRQKYINQCKANFHKWAEDNRFLVRYVRDGKRNKVGVVVARLSAEGLIEFGWSKANVSKSEKFDRYIGLNSAIERIEGKRAPAKQLPRKVGQTVQQLANAALRYFHLDKEELKERTLDKMRAEGLGMSLLGRLALEFDKTYAD